jgi:C_GCAxxG_C_C family probable redox protein
LTEEAVQRSHEFRGKGYRCAESVLLAIAESRGIRSELIPRVATGFCSGLSHTCGLCGAVSGAIMGLSIAAGRDLPGQPVEPSYALVREFLQAFRARFGSTNCYELTGCDLGTEEGQSAFRASNVAERCEGFVAEATRLAMTLLQGWDRQEASRR